jgi:quinol monooxygenase YgiN
MTAFAAFVVALVAGQPAPADAKAAPQIGHMVFFKLKDATPENKRKMVAACDKYLRNHEGVVYFSAGVRAEAFDREVNDTDWDVALHMVFTDKAAHDKYQDHPDHLKFIEENKDLWGKVRVFDSEITPPGPKPKAAVVK